MQIGYIANISCRLWTIGAKKLSLCAIMSTIYVLDKLGGLGSQLRCANDAAEKSSSDNSSASRCLGSRSPRSHDIIKPAV